MNTARLSINSAGDNLRQDKTLEWAPVLSQSQTCASFALPAVTPLHAVSDLLNGSKCQCDTAFQHHFLDHCALLGRFCPTAHLEGHHRTLPSDRTRLERLLCALFARYILLRRSTNNMLTNCIMRAAIQSNRMRLMSLTIPNSGFFNSRNSLKSQLEAPEASCLKTFQSERKSTGRLT